MNAFIEELSLAAWPALQTIVYDGWILRFADGYTKRSNSVNPLYGSTIALDRKIDVCEALYREQSLPAVFKLGVGGEIRAIDSILEARGYERLDETSVQVLELGAREGRKLGGVELSEEFDAVWIEGFCACHDLGEKRGIIERLLANVLASRIVARKTVAGEIVACGFGALDRGSVGIFDIIVRKDRRGRGFGEEIMRAIIGRAAALGAEGAYLQVLVGNGPAEALYKKLGFEEAYRYFYRRITMGI